jgi:hypothetical protein
MIVSLEPAVVDEREDDQVDQVDQVEQDPDPGVESEWALEIERRARRAISGESEGINCDAVLSRIERRLSGT